MSVPPELEASPKKPVLGQTENDPLLPCGHPSISSSLDVLDMGQCAFQVGKKLSCGHIADMPCYARVMAFACQVPVERTLSCGHTAELKCFQQLAGCPFRKIHQFPCGHKIIYFCGMEPGVCPRNKTQLLDCGHEAPFPCGGPVPICRKLLRKKLECGHGANYNCGDPEPKECQETVRQTFSCGHFITGKCYIVSKQLTCLKIKTKKRDCGHKLKFLCGTVLKDLPKCQEVITKDLPCHHSVSYECGSECPPCDVDVSWGRKQCGHSIVFKCGEPDGINTAPCLNHKCKSACVRGHPCLRPHNCNDPCPPCELQVTFRFGACSHSLEVPCHRGDEKDSRACREECERERLCSHPCPLPCGQHAPDEGCPCCQVLVKRTRYCGHEMTSFCGLRLEDRPCDQPVNVKDKSPCGHDILIECFRAEEVRENEGILFCNKKCTYFFDPEFQGCGHFCSGTCKECAGNLFHKECAEKCSKTLFCGHQCASRCSSSCLKCETRCENSCEHGPCKYLCSQPCLPCKEPCSYGCIHGKCSRECGEVCDKAPCRESCPKTLEKCGHPCIGYCGEPCPSLCLTCDKEELLEGCFTGQESLTSSDRFVVLIDCGHSIEAESLDQLMRVSVVEGQIVPKQCPLCRKFIRNCKRYSRELKQIWEDIETVKRQLFGDPKEIATIQNEISRCIHQLFVDHFDPAKLSVPGHLKQLKDALLNVAIKILDFKGMSLEEARRFKFITKIMGDMLGMASKDTKNLPQNHRDYSINFFGLIAQFLTSRSSLPLTPFELHCLSQEWVRIMSMTALFKKKEVTQPDTIKQLLKQPRGDAAFYAAFDVINSIGPFHKGLQAEFAEAMKELEAALECKIGIPDSERMDILKAFNYSMGRWFKCPNGHVYVVTECGGVTEEGTCNECGEKVGGKNHSVLPTNDLASEMDGAQGPLYPTALERQLARL